MSDTRPRIGDFRSKPANEVRAASVPAPPTVPNAAPEAPPESAPPPPAPTPPPAPAAEENEPPPPKTLAEQYADTLKLAGLSLKEAHGIFDAVMSKGYYEEYVRLPGNKRAAFRTRSYDDQLRAQTALEVARPQIDLTMVDILQRYNLAASLVEWNGKALKHESDDDFDDVLKLVKKLPLPVYQILVRKLVAFDNKIAAVFADGAPDSF
jgi:hypothetical protein